MMTDLARTGHNHDELVNLILGAHVDAARVGSSSRKIFRSVSIQLPKMTFLLVPPAEGA